MNNYKSTLNLPKTKFPMKGNLASLEPKILSRWIHDNLYEIVRSAKKGKKKFILHDGPPYGNGSIHIGHAVNKILKDFIIKSKGLSGFDVSYIPGWDCHGLPIEMKIEKKYININKKKNTDIEFRKKCQEYALTQIKNQKKDFVRLGILGDWLHSYSTMDFKIEANTIRALAKIIKNGHLQMGTKPIHWCIKCCSALAGAEVEYYEKTSVSAYVLFKATNENLIKNKFNLLSFRDPIFLVVWTTTLWTLPASRSVSLSSTFEYAMVQIIGKILIIEKNLVEKLMKYFLITNYSLLNTIKATELELFYFNHPFLDYDVPITISNHISSNEGTGIVHIAGNYGLDDHNISLNYGLEIIDLISEDGIYLPGTHPKLDGVNIFKSNNIIINLLKSNNTLLHFEKFQHSYPFCWRHKYPTIFRATKQWFISMDKKGLRKELLKKIDSVKWIPSWSKECINKMIINRPDWCISRQRTWGVPIPLFIHKKTNELHPNTLLLIEKIAKQVEIGGTQIWWDLNIQDIIETDFSSYKKVSDTLDVWFESGSTHFSVIDSHPEFFGNHIDMYLEGFDQHRGWFMSSLITSVAMKDTAPYRQVLTHGFVVDKDRKKMSKSLGNAISPQKIVKDLGADIFRLWVASIDYTSEMSISNEILDRTSDNYRRIRNTIRFFLSNLNEFNPDKDIIKPKQMVELDRWAINCAKKTQEKIIKAYDSYEFYEVIQYIMYFCSVEMGSFYLDLIKDRQYTVKKDSLARRSCQTALYHILEAMTRWIAPIISFTADEILSYLPGNHTKYIFTEEWYKGLFELNENEEINDAFWEELLKIRNEVNKVIEIARSEKKIGNSLEAEVKLYVEPNLKKKLSILGKELRFFLLTSYAKIEDYSKSISNSYQSKLIKGLKISLSKAKGKKCPRCWNYAIEISIDNKNCSKICKRCTKNVFGNGEKRIFV